MACLIVYSIIVVGSIQFLAWVLVEALQYFCRFRSPNQITGQIFVAQPLKNGFSLSLKSPFSIPVSSDKAFRPTLTLSSSRSWGTFSAECELFSSRRRKPDVVTHLDFSFFDRLIEGRLAELRYHVNHIKKLTDETCKSPRPNSLKECPNSLKECPNSLEECPNSLKDGVNLSVIICNRPLPLYTDVLLRYASGFVVCADGGANRLVDYFGGVDRLMSVADGKNRQLRQERLPDAVVGDMDSVKTEVRRAMESRSVPFVHFADQDTTDLEKSFSHFQELIQQPSAATRLNKARRHVVVIIGATGGRFDQTVCNHHLMYKLTRTSIAEDLQLIFLDNNSFCCLCPKGQSELHLPSKFVLDMCGLLPLGACRSVSTLGLKWNLSKCHLDMMGLVSSSNRVVSHTNKVLVDTSDPCFWFSEVNSDAWHYAEAKMSSQCD